MTTYLDLYFRYKREGYTHIEAASKADWYSSIGVAVDNRPKDHPTKESYDTESRRATDHKTALR